jgi:hypothetical protein
MNNPETQGTTETAPGVVSSEIVTRHNVSLELTTDEVIDLRNLLGEIEAYRPVPWNKCERARDAERYWRIINKILSAV